MLTCCCDRPKTLPADFDYGDLKAVNIVNARTAQTVDFLEEVAATYAACLSVLREYNIDLVFVNTSSAEQAEEYLKRYEKIDPFPGKLVLDKEKESHRLFGFRYGIYRSLIPPIILGVPKYGVFGAIRGAILGWKNFNLAGSSWQQGGTAVLKRTDEGKVQVLYLKQEEHPADFAPVSDVLAACGVEESKIPQVSPSKELEKSLAKADKVKGKSTIEDPAAFVTAKMQGSKPVLFAKSYCKYCKATKKLLDGLGIEYDLHDLDLLGEPENGPVQKELSKISNITSTPQLFFGGKFVGDNGSLQKMKPDQVKAVLGS
ncbi:hypothetical protein TrST_g7753 [Triparma strigata]|uniref:Glutaredoxin domain-containing protein n=1 Tax=Triparma strigata TaxID=1606541 RepID=A0A9W7EYX0_9STRA|nr:hypothetical protein TrST_g7753 [Triparma strigata]